MGTSEMELRNFVNSTEASFSIIAKDISLILKESQGDNVIIECSFEVSRKSTDHFNKNASYVN